jgi:hypothetical protein
MKFLTALAVGALSGFALAFIAGLWAHVLVLAATCGWRLIP